MIELNVNVDHIATVRQARGGIEPSPLEGALIALEVGAHGIVVHLREDRRHIQDKDVFEIRSACYKRFDLEMGNTPEIIEIAIKVKPDLITLVPEKRQELTTEGGLDVITQKYNIAETIKRMNDNGVPTSLFIEPNNNHIEISKEIGAKFVELHTGHYANLIIKSEIEAELTKINKTVQYAHSIGLEVVAGHGLNYTNTQPFTYIDNIKELSIGHSIISRSLMVGIGQAVKEMLQILGHKAN